MLSEMVGRVGNDSICKCGLSVNGCSYMVCSFFYGNIKIVYCIVLFCSVSAVKCKFVCVWS